MVMVLFLAWVAAIAPNTLWLQVCITVAKANLPICEEADCTHSSKQGNRSSVRVPACDVL